MVAFDVKYVFEQEFSKAIVKEAERSGFPLDQWFNSGRQSPVQAVESWFEKGPGYVQNFIDWWEANPDFKVWVTPDGVPAIELPVECYFGSVPFRGYIDLIVEAGNALVAVDLKSSAKTPDNLRQLGLYACAVEKLYGRRPKYGSYFMFRGTGKKDEDKTFFQRPVPLDGYQYSIEYLTRQLEQFNQAANSGLFLANPGEGCNRCPVAHACAEVGGQEARKYDPSHPGYRPRVQIVS